MVKKVFSLLLSFAFVLTAVSANVSSALARPEPELTAESVNSSDLYGRMMHISKTSVGTCELKTSVPVKIGKNYIFSFALSDSMSETHFEVVARVNNGNWTQPGVASGKIRQISQKAKGKSVFYSYRIPITETDSANIGSNQVYFIIRLKNAAVCDGYLFAASATEAESKTELLSNPNFEFGLKGWVGGYKEYKDGEMSGSDSSGSTTFEILDFNTLLTADDTPEKMLHIQKTGTSDVFELRCPIEVTVGNKYLYSFALTDNISENDFETVFRVVSNAWGGRVGVTAEVNKESVAKRGSTKYYSYSVTIPKTDNNGNPIAGKAIYFILRFKKQIACDGYFFGAEITDYGINYAPNLIKNANFESGLKYWTATNRDFTTNVAEGTDSNNTTALSVTDFNSEIYRTMLKIRNENVDMVGESLLLPIGLLAENEEYKISFSYYFVNGALNESADFVLIDSPSDEKKRIRLIQSSAENSPIEYTAEDDGVTVSYSFALDSDQAEKYTDLYAGFFFRQEAKYITEMYIADFTLRLSADKSNENLFRKRNFWDMGGWRSNYTVAASGSEEFGREQSDSLNYSAEYVAYDESLFIPKKFGVNYGDGNYDGNIDIRDLIVLKKNAAGVVKYCASLDFDGDGSVDAADLSFLRRYLLGTEKIVWDVYKNELPSVPKISGGADDDAAMLKSEISDLKDGVSNSARKRIFYVAEKGSYANDGLSPDRPITADKLNKITYKSGDAVLFKRGDLFRIQDYLIPQSGVYYGAYGSGEKPVISGSAQNYAERTLWETEDGNIWSTRIYADDIGNIVMNGGEYYGNTKPGVGELKSDGDFFFDRNTSTLYLCLRQINPGSRFDSIEISSTRRFMNGNSASDITVENLNIVYFREHAINLIKCSDVCIRGCEFEWIGGGYIYDSASNERTESRYGNAIQFWNSAKNCNVYKNSFYQIYDAAMTFQGYGGGEYLNLSFTENLVEYSGMNFEFWDSGENVSIQNIEFSKNILRFGGFGFCNQRKNKGNMAFILAWNNSYESSEIRDFNITGNIFDVAYCSFYYATKAAGTFNMYANTYFQNGCGFYSIIKGSSVYGSNSSDFISEIKKIDSNPTAVWLH